MIVFVVKYYFLLEHIHLEYIQPLHVTSWHSADNKRVLYPEDNINRGHLHDCTALYHLNRYYHDG